MKTFAYLLAAGFLATSALAEVSSFKPTKIRAPFLEQFTEDWDLRWKASGAVKEKPKDAKHDENANLDDLYRYRGQWAVEAPSRYGIKDDKGLVAKTAAAHHAISAGFARVVDPDSKDLVIQYDVKFQEDLQCGGAYIKLLTDSKNGIKYQEFDDKTPYTIMFGPDKCGTTNKVHFIFRHRNPKTGEVVEKHLTNPPSIRSDTKTNLYTLVVHPDNSLEIYINKEKVKNGNLLEDFDPPVNPPKELDDPEDTKPEDWVDEAQIPDPEAKKPEDWDEDAPRMIPDPDAKIPSDWLEEESEFVSDPSAEKPEDWDDEEDGEWVAPQIPNPKCAKVSGCGPWKRPTKVNPAYKGKWYPPLVANPKYSGVWAPRKVANPDFFEDLKPSKFTKLSGVGIEIWTMQANILFDNFYVGYSLDDAFALADETWKVRHDLEEAEEEKERKAAEEAASKEETSSSTTTAPVTDKGIFDEFVNLLATDPVAAAQKFPGLAGGLLALILAPAALYILVSRSASKDVDYAKRKKTDAVTKDDEEEEDEAVEADDEKEDKPRKRKTNKEE